MSDVITLDTIELPGDLVWSDEFEWSEVAQSEEYFLAGSMEIQTSVKQVGRPITLTPFGGRYSWVTRATALAIQAFVDTPGKEMSLTMADGRSFTVQFRHGDGNPLVAHPRFPKMPPEANDWYTLTAIRLMITA